MDHSKLNRPFASYVLTQSSLVLIVLASSYIATELLAKHTGISISRVAVSLWLIGLSQLPTAMLYAKRESRTLTSSEGWIFGFAFVLMTLTVEFCLQLLVGQAWPKIDIVLNLMAAGNWHLLVIGICGFLLGIILAAFAFKTIFRFSVRNNLEGETPPFETEWLNKFGRVKANLSIRKLRPRHKQQDYAGQFRRVLVATNVGVFALSIVYPGPQYLEILSICIPVTILFSIILVANNLAKTVPDLSILKRCWEISWKLLPLTLTSFLFLGISDLYLANTKAHGQSGQLLSDVSTALVENPMAPTDILIAFAYLAAFFVLCLAVNTGLLVLFSRLIRPLIVQTVGKRRPSAQSMRPAAADSDHFPQKPSVWVRKSPEIMAVLARSKRMAQSKLAEQPLQLGKLSSQEVTPECFPLPIGS